MMRQLFRGFSGVLILLTLVGPVRAQSAGPLEMALPTPQDDTLHFDEHRGEVVVINFWASWCSICRHEIPELAALRKELRGDDVLFVGASMDERPPPIVAATARELGITYPVVTGGPQLAEQLGGIPGVPTTIVLGPEGHVQRRFVGRVPMPKLRSAVVRLLKQPGE